MSGGVGAAVGEALASDAAMADVVQAGLFEDLEVHDTGALDAPSPLSAALPSVRRGRPRGSKNRRTEAVTSWLLSQHRHPLSVIMEAYSMTTVDLAAQLGLSRAMVEETVTVTQTIDDKEVATSTTVMKESDRFDNDVLLDLFKLQMRMAEVAAPYVAQKITATGDGESGPTLNVSFAALNLGGSGVSVPARGDLGSEDLGGGMSVRLGQVGRAKSDADPTA